MSASLKTVRHLLSFYRSFALVTILLSVCGGYILFKAGIKILPLVCWFKLISTGIVVWYIRQYKRKEFFYYHNLGLSKTWLWTVALTADLFLFILVLFAAAALSP